MGRPARHQDGGFTLLEILLALIVLGLLMVGLNQGVRTGLRMMATQTRQVGATADLDTTARVLRGLLTAVPLSPAAATNQGGGAFAISFNGTAEELSFVGDMPTGLGDTRRADITVKLHDGRLVILWAPHRHDQAAQSVSKTETELLRGVARLDLAYWGIPSPNAPLGWLERWDGPALPAVIRIRLGFAKSDPRRWPDMLVAPQLWTPES